MLVVILDSYTHLLDLNPNPNPNPNLHPNLTSGDKSMQQKSIRESPVLPFSDLNIFLMQQKKGLSDSNLDPQS